MSTLDDCVSNLLALAQSGDHATLRNADTEVAAYLRPFRGFKAVHRKERQKLANAFREGSQGTALSTQILRAIEGRSAE